MDSNDVNAITIIKDSTLRVSMQRVLVIQYCNHEFILI